MFLFDSHSKIKDEDVSDKQKEAILSIVSEMIKYFSVDSLLDIVYQTGPSYTCHHCPFFKRCDGMSDDEKMMSNCKERIFEFTKED